MLFRIGLLYAAVFGLIMATVAACDPAFARPACLTTTLSDRIALAEAAPAQHGQAVHFGLADGGKGVTRLVLIMGKEGSYSAAIVFFKDQCQMPLPPLVVDPEQAARHLFNKSLAAIFEVGTPI